MSDDIGERRLWLACYQNGAWIWLVGILERDEERHLASIVHAKAARTVEEEDLPNH